MTFYPSSELLLDPSPSRVADSLPGQLARGAARGAQLARRSDPRPFAARPRGGAGSFALSLAIEAWDLFTAEPAPAPLSAIALPDLPVGLSYRIEGSGTIRDSRVPPAVESSAPIFQPAVFGGLGTISIRQGAAGQAVYVTSQLGTPNPVEVQLSTGQNNPQIRWIRIDTLVVTPNQGNPSPVPGLLPYPTAPQLDDYQENIPILIPITAIPGVSPIITLIPVIIPRPSDLGRRPVPLLYPSGLTPAQREALPPIWFLPDGVQVGRGYADDRVTSTTGDAIDVNIDLDLLTDYQIRNPPNNVVCTADPEPPDDCCDCDSIRQIVFEELDEKFPPRRPFFTETITYPASDSISITLPEFAQWVTIDIVEPPRNVREQEGNAQAPNVFYNGWYSFGVETETGDRQPIQYNSVSVPVPVGARQFSYTIIGLGTASLTVGYYLEQ